MELHDKISSLYNAYFYAVAKSDAIPVHCRSLHQGVDSGMSPDVASSVEFIKLVELPATILDLGAGVSTYVFRSLFDNVITIDSDHGYLEFVRSICRKSNLSNDNFFCGMRHIVADYIFFDYGTTDDRIRLLEQVVSYGKKLIWVNDADNRPAVRPLINSLHSLSRRKGFVV